MELADQIICGENAEFPRDNDFLIVLNRRILLLMSKYSIHEGKMGIDNPMFTTKNIDNYITGFIDKLTTDYKLMFAKDLLLEFNTPKKDNLVDNSKEFIRLLRQYKEAIRGW